MPRSVWVERRDRVDWKRSVLSLLLGQLPDEERHEWRVLVEDDQGRRVEATTKSEVEAEEIRTQWVAESG